MKSRDDRRVLQAVVATGISSVVTQLLSIREFLAQFQSNEIVIALIFFNWLVLGGLGTLAARYSARRCSDVMMRRLGWLSLLLAVLPVFQIFAIRGLRDLFFIHGASVGFYPTLCYTFAIVTPYCMLVGYVLPYSLFALRAIVPGYPGSRVYIADNIGDICGGAIFSFVLIVLVTPLAAIALANLLLIVAACRLARPSGVDLPMLAAAGGCLALLAGGVLLERASLAPREGVLAYYRESRYGRIEVHKENDQYTLFADGIPLFGSQDISLREESVHFALAQRSEPKRVLVVAAHGGILKEIAKYKPQRVEYVELNPAVSDLLFDFGLLRRIDGLDIVHQDGRAFLSSTDAVYDAILVNLPEPDTFQVNRFYTERFFSIARQHLSAEGILTFSSEGFENYLAEPQRRKLSSLFNTVRGLFTHVRLIPGQRVFFLCSNQPIRIDIPTLLSERGIHTEYIQHYFEGDISQQRIEALEKLLDPSVSRNTDESPYLMQLMFIQWFTKFDTSPTVFILILSALGLLYVMRMSSGEFVLFTTGAVAMGSEIITIFAFQIYFGYVYTKIGLIVTVFLAGLLPGAWHGEGLRPRGHRVLAVTDLLLICLLGGLAVALGIAGGHLSEAFFLCFGFIVALLCGCQFPVALYLCGDDRRAATRTFSADLIGAAFGALITSTVLVPYFGLIRSILCLIGMKLISLIINGLPHERLHPA